MRKIKFATVLMMMGVSACLVAKDTDLRKSFEDYIYGADKRNSELLNKVMHTEFRNGFSVKGDKKVNLGNKKAYLELIKEGKIGGLPRKIEIISIESFDNVGVIRAKVSSSKIDFNGSYLFVNENGIWQILQDMQVATFK